MPANQAYAAPAPTSATRPPGAALPAADRELRRAAAKLLARSASLREQSERVRRRCGVALDRLAAAAESASARYGHLARLRRPGSSEVRSQ